MNKKVHTSLLCKYHLNFNGSSSSVSESLGIHGVGDEWLCHMKDSDYAIALPSLNLSLPILSEMVVFRTFGPTEREYV